MLVELYAYLQGIWGGLIGGTALQTAILLWVTIRTDWTKEVFLVIKPIVQIVEFTFPFFCTKV